MERRERWNAIYGTKDERQVSWTESVPVMSLRLMEAAGLTPETCVIDVGGGDSQLVDHLVERGLRCLAVLDISGAALQRAQVRVGPSAAALTWIEADVTADWSLKPMDIWHDRAVFHFLTEPADRRRYVEHIHETLKHGGALILATFALDGPERCSGLPVLRYSSETLATELGSGFDLVESLPYVHRTPWGSTQSFQYSRFMKLI